MAHGKRRALIKRLRKLEQKVQIMQQEIQEVTEQLIDDDDQ